MFLKHLFNLFFVFLIFKFSKVSNCDQCEFSFVFTFKAYSCFSRLSKNLFVDFVFAFFCSDILFFIFSIRSCANLLLILKMKVMISYLFDHSEKCGMISVYFVYVVSSHFFLNLSY